MKQSIFHLHSIGKAAVNLKRNSRSLEVLAIENTIGSDGEINFDPIRLSGKYTNEQGETIQTEEIISREIECLWLPTDDNRLTPPDIRRGELVEVWRKGDTDEYYWRSMALRNDLRALESVIYAWGATPDLEGHQNDLTKCYLFSVSAHDKHFTFRTSKANGELYQYTFQINTKDDAVYLQDDDGQLIEIDSKERRVKLINKDNSFVRVEKKFIELQADEYINLKVKDNNFRMTPDSTKLDTPSTIEVTSGSVIGFKTTTFEVISSSIISFKTTTFEVISSSLISLKTATLAAVGPAFEFTLGAMGRIKTTTIELVSSAIKFIRG